MASIVTLHGTFASGADTGSEWWQKGSQFEAEVQGWIESADGQLQFLPQVWDGRNSEISRRSAGLNLLSMIQKLEASGQNYCLIGHSHGGSVVAAALVASNSHGYELSNLSRWITVGTPFITRRDRALLFTRVGILAKSAYLTFLSFGLLVSTLVILQALGGDLGTTREAIISGVAFFVLLSFCPLAIFHTLLWFVERRASRYYKTTLPQMKSLVTRWLSLRHPSDEAIAGLRAAEGFRFPIFGSRFMVEPITTIAALVGPFIFTMLVWVYIVPSCLGQACYPLYLFFANFISPVFHFLYLENLSLSPFFEYLVTWFAILIFLIGVPAALFVVSYAFMLGARIMARLVSGFASKRLDRVVWNEIRRTSFGDDAADAVSGDVRASPPWAETDQPALPSELADELKAVSDGAAAISISKFRAALQQMIFRGSEQGRSEIVSEYLTWDELIHTSYFRAVRFRKLLAYAISQSSGFRASDAFKRDPEFKTVAGWYDQLVQPSVFQDHRSQKFLMV